MFGIIYLNFVPTPKQGAQLYFLSKPRKIFKQLFERKKERNLGVLNIYL